MSAVQRLLSKTASEFHKERQYLIIKVGLFYTFAVSVLLHAMNIDWVIRLQQLFESKQTVLELPEALYSVEYVVLVQ